MTRPHYMASIDACAAHYGDDADAMREFLIAGHEKAMQLDNRGLSPLIQAAHWSPVFCRPTASMVSMCLPTYCSRMNSEISRKILRPETTLSGRPRRALAADGSPGLDLIALH